ncbi:PAS-domain containing protein [Xanthomonas sp. XNM01]|uniref:hybrid sensor histidine kinase/response regulator n=1 Tax=Xanthomonas sp. XNM01 TaxID=2769289 RepID=UPI00177B9706|nr:PAS-domain containing protein [Xanthomonas sp. XNM01]MBD9370059.1 PAS-domain containing protein [Xanthomonas sp. XNM01]
MYISPRRRLLLTVLVLVGGMLLAMAAAWRLGSHRALEAESAALQRQLGLQALALEQRIDRYRTLPEVLALDPELREATRRDTLDEATRRYLNHKLERANAVTRSSTLTLLDPHGVALAASNWREPTSNVGENYSYRPYVTQALSHGSGRFYGIGMTTGQAGYYLSQAMVEDDGSVIGIVVIKIELAALEQEWLQSADVILASDAHGVVFLASRDAWRYRLLAPLSDSARAEMRRTRQYADLALLPLQRQVIGDAGDGGLLVRAQSPSLPGPVVWQHLALPQTGWQLHVLHDAGGIARAGRNAALGAATVWLALAFLVLFVQQRRRLAALRQRSRRELEVVLQQHAEELRTAQDGIVQAAQLADTGLARSLKHLPQGVVIIDADLRIAAWNSRYIELFRFPPDLIQVGRPIEDVFRFNARRGLLGAGPVEEAIQRRLDHLRSGKSHMRESEKDDGTVLEIRGNPLPDGGFVTSYADITSYKTTARELRSLADALEQRIAERTQDLEQARHEAVEANRYKTRFVAAAVHDLLQPLNAARMFLSALRGRLRDAQTREEADSVESALAAQDAILASLLDISRLESGTQQVRVADFPLDPLLEALAREFGILAEARGLVLERVPTRAIVRTDEHLLRRILQNLLSNAVRYTPRGRILLGYRREGGSVRIEVLDTGPGIPPNRQREIFEEFRRLDDGGASERGAGLGLAIVERIARLLGHPIGLRSQPGSGSCFSVTVPRGDAAALRAPEPAATAPAADSAEDSPLLGCVAWCVDDDARVSEATRALLERWGCVVAYAGGPQDALAAAAVGNAPQILLMDVRLGTLHGPDVQARLQECWQRSVPTILVTAEHDEALRAQAADNGWGFLSKPVRPAALRALMSQMLLRHR